MEGLNKMEKKPRMLYSDEEGSLYSNTISEYLEDEKIEIHRTRGHPAFAERFIKTYKDKLFKRIEADEKKGKENIQWIDYNLEILLTYNNKDIHSSHNMTPKEARLPKNELKVKLSLNMNAKRSRIYPEIDEGDNVKIMRKKGISEKEHTSHWNKTIHKVTKIEKKLGQHYYHLDDDKQPYLRHELLKVS